MESGLSLAAVKHMLTLACIMLLLLTAKFSRVQLVWGQLCTVLSLKINWRMLLLSTWRRWRCWRTVSHPLDSRSVISLYVGHCEGMRSGQKHWCLLEESGGRWIMDHCSSFTTILFTLSYISAVDGVVSDFGGTLHFLCLINMFTADTMHASAVCAAVNLSIYHVFLSVRHTRELSQLCPDG